MQVSKSKQIDVDKKLVARVQAGDNTAFDLLVKKYQPRVISILNRYEADQQEVLDLAQDTFIKAYKALTNFRGDSNFYTWLYRITVNTAKNHVAKNRKKIINIDFDEAENLIDSASLQELETPETKIYQDEMLALIQASLNKLPEELKTALLLREFDGLSYEQIAEQMNCPIGTVRSRISRARLAVDQALLPYFQPKL